MNAPAAGPALTGAVKFFLLGKGYGFIVRDDGGDDVFVHISAVSAAGLVSLDAGQRLSFRLCDAPGGRGRQACDLLLLENAPAP
ncbi:MAG TPA: cold shock domain-containing protein [Thermopetrobacter sp.]|nr:cold shock domain-containing protein [Thermopetrobacter sp.]